MSPDAFRLVNCDTAVLAVPIGLTGGAVYRAPRWTWASLVSGVLTDGHELGRADLVADDHGPRWKVTAGGGVTYHEGRAEAERELGTRVATAVAAPAPAEPCGRCRTAPPVAGVCCSSHAKKLCHRCYRLTHFVEVCSAGCELCAVEGLPVVMSR